MQYPILSNVTSIVRVAPYVLFLLSINACSTIPANHTTQLADAESSLFQQNIHGYIVDNDEVTPLYDATVAILGEPTSDGKEINKSCSSPSKPHIVYTCTNEDGSFKLDLSQVHTFPVTLSVEKEGEIREITLTQDALNSELGTIALLSDENAAKEKVAVVMDFYNPLQDIQEFLNANPSQTQQVKLQLMNEYQNLYEINGENRDITYPTFYSLFTDSDKDGKADIFNYDVVYINSRQKSDIALLDQSLRKQLLDYISNGGYLYITEWTVELETEEPSPDEYI